MFDANLAYSFALVNEMSLGTFYSFVISLEILALEIFFNSWVNYSVELSSVKLGVTNYPKSLAKFTDFSGLAIGGKASWLPDFLIILIDGKSLEMLI